MSRTVQLTAFSACLAASALGLDDSGTSREAETLRQALAETRTHSESSVALFGARSNVIDRLWRLYNECADAGWDGYDASPMSIDAARSAVDLIRALPEGIPWPELTAENDGAISLDWTAGRKRCLSVSTNGSERLAFAWLDGARSGSGVELFLDGRWPIRLLDEIEGIYGNRRHSSIRT